MNIVISQLHVIYKDEVSKVALSAEDDKRVIITDGIHTLAIIFRTSLKNIKINK